jgi:hypothetical protein
MPGPENNPRDDEPFDQESYEKWAAEQNTVLRSLFEEIRAEREAQDAEWGGTAHDDTHTQFDWWDFIKQHNDRSIRGQKRDDYRKQLIRIAALAVAAVQAFDRKKGKGK